MEQCERARKWQEGGMGARANVQELWRRHMQGRVRCWACRRENKKKKEKQIKKKTHIWCWGVVVAQKRWAWACCVTARHASRCHRGGMRLEGEGMN
jgi:hypothetical protein